MSPRITVEKEGGIKRMALRLSKNETSDDLIPALDSLKEARVILERRRSRRTANKAVEKLQEIIDEGDARGFVDAYMGNRIGAYVEFERVEGGKGFKVIGKDYKKE